MPQAQIDSPSTLLPPQGQPEREAAGDPAVGGARERGALPFASQENCSREEKLETEFGAQVVVVVVVAVVIWS